MPINDNSPIRIACIGDSITEGIALADPQIQAWPAIAQRLLGDRATVGNFGVGGATIAKRGDKPYWDQPAYVASRAWNPTIVIIMLGTNDARSANDLVRHEVLADLAELVDSYATLSSLPRIILCTPIPAFRANHTVNPGFIGDVLAPGIRALAGTLGRELFDAYTLTDDLGPTCADGIHPDVGGNLRLTERIVEFLQLNLR